MMSPGKNRCFVLLTVWAIACNRALAAGDSTAPALLPSGPRTEPCRAMAPGVYNLTYRSKVDGSLQPLLVRVPPGYSPQRKWPLLVTLHGRGDGPILAPGMDAMVQIGPFGRGSVNFTGIGERDVFDCIDVACTLFSIDTDRLYLCGFSMGAGAAFELGLKFPHIWAACVPVCGDYDDLPLVSNARHLPFWIHAGGKDIMVPARQVRQVYEYARRLGFSHWQYTEHPNMKHEFGINWDEVQAWLLRHQRVCRPAQCTFATADLRSNSAYWMTITAIDRCDRPARIDVAVAGQTIFVETDNVAAYTLDLRNSPVNTQRDVRILENDLDVFHDVPDATGRFVQAGETSQTPAKKHGVSGPLWDIYSAPCLLICGTGGEQALVKAARLCAETFASPAWMSRVTFPVLADKDVSEAAVQDHNLVLFGDVRSNPVLAEIVDRLPIRMERAAVVTERYAYSTPDTGFVLIYPHPLNPERYVAVFAGNTPRAANCFADLWPRFGSIPRDIDFGVFQLLSDGATVKWLDTGIFDAHWRWPAQQSSEE